MHLFATHLDMAIAPLSRAVGPLPTGATVRLDTGIPLSASPPYRAGRHTDFLLDIGFQVQPGTWPIRAVGDKFF